MAQKGRKKKEEARLRQEQSRQAKEQKAMAAWQEIVDEAHAEAIQENNIRTVDDIINKAYSTNEELLNNITYNITQSAGIERWIKFIKSLKKLDSFLS